MRITKDILLIEDEQDLGSLLSMYFQSKGYVLDWCTSAEAGHIKFIESDYRLVILDVQLPKEDGFSMAKTLKQQKPIQAILFLTAFSGKENRKKGLEIGAFDYIEKPFELDECMLKIQNILQSTIGQHKTEDSSPMYQLGKTAFDTERLTLTSSNGEVQKLTVREAEILQLLFENKNKLVAKKDILIQFWGDTDYFNGKSLEVFVSRLRKMFKNDSSVKIESKYGAGYILVIQDGYFHE